MPRFLDTRNNARGRAAPRDLMARRWRDLIEREYVIKMLRDIRVFFFFFTELARALSGVAIEGTDAPLVRLYLSVSLLSFVRTGRSSRLSAPLLPKRWAGGTGEEEEGGGRNERG